MASSGPYVSSEALRDFRHRYCVTHWGKKVVFAVYENSFLYGQTKGISEILDDNGISLTMKSPFTTQDIKNLIHKRPAELDITVMNKICQALWQKKTHGPVAELKGLVKKIKDVRNLVSHDAHDISVKDLEDKLKDLQATFVETLDKTKSVFPAQGVKIDELKADIQVAIPEMLRKIREKYDPSNPQDVQKLKQEITEFWTEFSEEVQKFSQEESRALYRSLCKILPFDWLAQYGVTDLSKIITYLKVEDDKQFSESGCDNQGTSVDQREILKIKNSKGEDPEVVIISGDAGSGKTTILCSFQEQWCKETKDIPELSSFPTLLYMKFKDESHDNFNDFLQGLLPKTVSRYDLTNVRSQILDSKCLILCDGYDEANANSKKLFEEMLELEWKDKKIVVTTRPGNTKELTGVVNSRKLTKINLRVSDLQEEDFNSLTEKLIGYLVKNNIQQEKKLKTELFQKIREMNIETKAILKTPLFFNIFIVLYVDCQDLRNELSTRASLYFGLKTNMAKRILIKTRITAESLEEFDVLYRKWSLKYYIEKKDEWSESDVEGFKKEISSQEVLQNFDDIMSSYFSIKHRDIHQQIVKVFCYRNKSEKEFAIAGNVCDDISNQSQQDGNILLKLLQSKGLIDSSVSDNNDLFKELRDIFSFIPGILYQKDSESDAFCDIIKDIQKLYVSHSLPQQGHDDLLEPCIGTNLDENVLQSLASLLEETPLKECLQFNKADSLCILPSLLSNLKPKRIELHDISRDLSELDEILQVTTDHGIYTKVQLLIDSNSSAAFSGEVSLPVDELEITFSNSGDKDEDSYPTSLMTSAKELEVELPLANISGRPRCRNREQDLSKGTETR